MTILYGVVHGLTTTDLWGQKQHHQISPCPELLNDLQALPRGARVALERFSDQDRVDLRADLQRHLESFGYQPDASRFGPHYHHDTYFDILGERCRDLGLQVLSIDDASNSLLLHPLFAEQEKKERLLQYRRENIEEGNPDKEEKAEILKLQEAVYHLALQQRYIIEARRDEAMLRRIAREQPDVAIVGLGHAEYWMDHRRRLDQSFGISFEDYHIPCIDAKTREPALIRDALPHLAFTLLRRSLLRSLHVVETGRLSEEKADMAGTWDLDNPWRGYFELFVEKRQGSGISGRIEDCLGTATFTGTVGREVVEFVKTYTRACSDAMTKPIHYQLAKKGVHLAGYYKAGFSRGLCYATTDIPMTPLEMVRYWREIVP